YLDWYWGLGVPSPARSLPQQGIGDRLRHCTARRPSDTLCTSVIGCPLPVAGRLRPVVSLRATRCPGRCRRGHKGHDCTDDVPGIEQLLSHQLHRMGERSREPSGQDISRGDLRTTLAVRQELGAEFEPALVESLAERPVGVIEARVDARLARRPPLMVQAVPAAPAL